MATKPKPKVVDPKDLITRAQAERAIARGAAPEQFLTHKNKHVRVKAQKKIAAKDAVLQAAVNANLSSDA